MHLGVCTMDHMELSSSVLRPANEGIEEDDIDSARETKFEFAEYSAPKSIDYSKHDEGMISIEQSNEEKPCQPSEFMSCDDDSIIFEDVKVCDICGDSGREDLLAVCSKCGDGAEHVYCMRTRLDKVPDDDWMCEECVLLEDKETMTKSKLEKFIAREKYKPSNQSYRCNELSKTSGRKVFPYMDSKGSKVNKGRGHKVSSLLSAVRTSSNLTSTVMRKRVALDTKGGLSLISRETKVPQPQNVALRPSRELPAKNGLSRTRSMQQNAAFPTISGNLTKSKSFNDSDKRRKFLRMDEITEKQFASEAHSKNKSSVLRSIRKSVSFNDASSGRSNAIGPKVRRIPMTLYDDSYWKTSRHQMCPPEDGLSCCAASRDKAFALHGESVVEDVCGTKCHKPEAVQSPRDSVNRSAVKRLCSPVDAVVQKSRSSTSSEASGEHSLASQKGSNQTEKPLRTSNFSCSSPDIVSKGSANGYCRGSNGLSRASQTQHMDSSKGSMTPILDGAMVKDRNGSSPVDLATPLCNQLTTLAFPKFDYIWKGEFEIHPIARIPRLLYRIQAHLSTQASFKIPEAVKNFSDKILLEEVSRLNAWPTQFQEHCPQDGSIGLYFFAEDIDSYGNYKSLLHCLIDYDLALRGNLNEIEVLIFSSNLLPKGSQYWNGMMFLWGVFKARKVNRLQPFGDSSLKSRPVG